MAWPLLTASSSHKAISLAAAARKPWHAAVERFCATQGYHPESFQALMLSNISFAEAVGTSINHNVQCEHAVGPAQSVVCSLSPSMRKTSMLDTVDRILLRHCDFPEDIICTDGTKKGAENHLHALRRLLLSSSEIANTLHLSGYNVPCKQFFQVLNVTSCNRACKR